MSLLHPILCGPEFSWRAYSCMAQRKSSKQKTRAMHACWLPQARSAWQAPVSPSIFNTLLARQAKCINKEPL